MKNEIPEELKGIPRKCPGCKTILHYDLKNKDRTIVECMFCGNEFEIQKYRKGERPK